MGGRVMVPVCNYSPKIFILSFIIIYVCLVIMEQQVIYVKPVCKIVQNRESPILVTPKL